MRRTLLARVQRALLVPRGVGAAWAGAVGAALVALLAWKLPTDPDLFWHVRAGNDILSMGIPRVDWYTHTVPTFPWIDHEWAIEVVMALVERVGGLRLVSVVFALLVAAILTVGLRWSLMARDDRGRRIGWPWVLLASAGVAGLAGSFLGARPQMLTYLLLLVLLGLLLRARQRPRLLWLVPPLMLAWANLHGSFILGIAVLGAWIGAEVLLRLIAELGSLRHLGKPPSYALLGRYLVVALLAVAATFLNPYLHGVWVEALRTLLDRELHKNIVEWFSPQVRSGPGALFFAASVVWVGLLTVRRTRLPLPLLAVTMMLWVASLLAVRNQPLFYLVAVPQAALALRELLPWPGKLLRYWPVLVVWTGLALACVLWAVPVRTLWSVGYSDEPYRAAGLPVGAAQYLSSHAELADARAFSVYGWGGYLLLHVPGFKTFIDGRMPSWEHEGVKIIDDYFTVDRLQPDWRAVLERYKVDLVVVPPDHKLVAALRHDDRFTELFRDEQAVVLSAIGQQ